MGALRGAVCTYPSLPALVPRSTHSPPKNFLCPRHLCREVREELAWPCAAPFRYLRGAPLFFPRMLRFSSAARRSVMNSILGRGSAVLVMC